MPFRHLYRLAIDMELMKASQLAKKLRALIKEHGDFEVDIDVKVNTSVAPHTMWFYTTNGYAMGYRLGENE